jgi:hypothetical protein
METKSYIIDGANFTNFIEFTQEFNRAFADIGANWNGNLDAFNDYLDWPTLETDGKYRLIWRHSGVSRQRLGYSEAAIWLRERMQHCHPTNVAHFTTRLLAAKQRQGPTLFDDLISIIREHPQINLKLE